MKIFPDYFSKANRIQRQISKRTANRIKEYVSCSDKLNSEQLTRNLILSQDMPKGMIE